MKRLVFALAMVLSSVATASADIVTQWDFNTKNLEATTGVGTASYVGGTAAGPAGGTGNTTLGFATGVGGGFGWNTNTYAAQSTGSGTAGVQFLASTVGFSNITLSFDHRASGTASRWAQLDYTVDGGSTWTTGFWNNAGGLSPHDNFYSFNVDLTSVAGASNNANFGVRIVSIFSPLAFSQNSTTSFGENAAYMRANVDAVYGSGPGVGTGNYSTAGTWRFDNVTISGSAVPEPTSMALLGCVMAGAAGLRFRRSFAK